MLRASRVRVLAIETSSSRGTVAVLDAGKLVVSLEHDQPNAHAERVLPLVERALAEAGFARTSVDRIGVGTGPGSFTGLRVGIALAEGLSLGLGIPIVGVASLRAMAQAVPSSDPRTRAAILDARRDEVFAAVYDASGRELLAPCAIPIADAASSLARVSEGLLYVGEFARHVAPNAERLEGQYFDLPHAREVGILAERLDPEQHPPDPIYVRGAGATLPNLPPSPISPSPAAGD